MKWVRKVGLGTMIAMIFVMALGVVTVSADTRGPNVYRVYHAYIDPVSGEPMLQSVNGLPIRHSRNDWKVVYTSQNDRGEGGFASFIVGDIWDTKIWYGAILVPEDIHIQMTSFVTTNDGGHWDHRETVVFLTGPRERLPENVTFGPPQAEVKGPFEPYTMCCPDRYEGPLGEYSNDVLSQFFTESGESEPLIPGEKVQVWAWSGGNDVVFPYIGHNGQISLIFKHEYSWIPVQIATVSKDGAVHLMTRGGG